MSKARKPPSKRKTHHRSWRSLSKLFNNENANLEPSVLPSAKSVSPLPLPSPRHLRSCNNFADQHVRESNHYIGCLSK